MTQKPNGFTLIEMAMVLVVSGLMLGFILKATEQKTTSTVGCDVATKAQLNFIKGQIEAFARANDRLPLPARRDVGIDNINYGREDDGSNITVSGSVSYGALPFQALGLPAAYAGDCWGNKFTYAVTTALTTNSDSGGFKDATVPGIITLERNGGTDTNTAIAYAVISHGQDQLGAVKLNYNNSGTPAWCTATANIATTNCEASGSTLVDATFNDGEDAGANYFDDLIIAAAKPEVIVESTGTAKLYCWGDNTNGKLGDGTTSAQNKPTAVDDTDEFILVSNGSGHSCGLKADGLAYCWGGNGSGQLGDASTTAKSSPTAVSGGTVFSNIAVGGSHSCALTPAGTAYCWGDNTYGKLGNGGVGATSTSPVAATMPGGKTFVSIAAGDNHTCAVSSVGDLYCWGRNLAGQLGDNSNTDKNVPTIVDITSIPGTKFASVALGSNFTCGLTDADFAYCWGSNVNGRLGIGGTPPLATKRPATRAGAQAFAVIAAGADHACAITTAGAAYCWGNNASGQLGDGTNTQRTSPTAVPGYTFIGLSAGDSSTCALQMDGKVYCWGSNASSQLGDEGAVASSSSPVQATDSGTDPTIFTSLSAGNGSSTHHCALVETDYSGRVAANGSKSHSVIKSDGTVWISDEDTGSVWTKRANASEGYAKVYSGGSRNPMLIKSDGTMQFYDMDPTHAFSDSIDTGWASVTGSWLLAAGGYNTVMGIKDDHTLWYYYEGTLSQVDAPTTYSKVSSGSSDAFCGVTLSAGQIKCWGMGNEGQLGNGSTSDIWGSPTAIAAGGIWRDVQMGGYQMYSTCGIRFDGSLYCWGRNIKGVLGVGDTAQHLTPMRVGYLKWKSITMPRGGSDTLQHYFVCGLTKGNDAYCWGDNSDYALGNGGTSDSSTPVLMPGNYKWLTIDAHRRGACGLNPAQETYCWGNYHYASPHTQLPTPTLQSF